MSRVKRLFQNRCSRRAHLVGLRSPASSMRGVHRSAVTAAAALTVAIVVSGLATGANALGGPVAPLLPHPWAAFDSGTVRTVFPSPLPAVDLFSSANSSLGGTVEVAAVAEVNLSGAVPQVVQEAFPSQAGSFGALPSPGPTSASVAFSAPLTVARTEGVLGATVEPLVQANTTTAASVDVLFGLPAPGTGSLSTRWSVTGWPYSAPSDSLALVLELSWFPAATLTACGTPGGSPVASGCAGTAIGNGTLVPDATIPSVAGALPTGAALSLTGLGGYSTWIAGTGAAAATVSLVSPQAGSTNLSAGLGLAFTIAPAPALAHALVGNPLVFGVAGVVAGMAATTGVVLARRRNRRLTDEL